MVEVTIVCLIYKSKQLAKAVYDSLYEYTPKLKNGEADLLFVANDPTTDLVDYLKDQKYPFIINVNDHLTDNELFKDGYGAPEYMRRVYQGYNQGVLNAKGQKVVLINSDNFFSTDWLENLLKYSDYKKVVTSTLIEPGQEKFGVFPGAIHKNFGKTLDDFKEKEFHNFANKIRKTGYTSGGAYMPCLLYKDVAVMAGLYPEGNIAGVSFDDIERYGDEFFYDRLERFGVEHITAKDSVVYHLKEGEKSELITGTFVEDVAFKRVGINKRFKIEPTDLMPYIQPESGHLEMLDLLGKKYTFIIINFNNEVELSQQIDKINSLENKNIEIIVLYDESGTKFVKNKHKGVKYVYSERLKKDISLYRIFYDMYGEYVTVSSPDIVYSNDLFERISSKKSILYFGKKQPVDGSIVDAFGYFIVPKRIVLQKIGLFLGFSLDIADAEIEADKCIRIDIEDVHKETVVDVVVTPPTPIVHSGLRSTISSTYLYRIVCKMYREGLRSAVRSAIIRLKNRNK